MQELTFSKVLCGHSILPFVKAGLELSVCIPSHDEATAHQLPLGKLLPGVQLHLRELVNHDFSPWFGRTTLLLVLAQIVHDGLATHKHCSTMTESRYNLLVTRTELSQLLQDLVDEVRFTNASWTCE